MSFFKWAGGKGRLLPQLLPLLPEDVRERRHVEPFLGGGAMFFSSRPRKALISDRNVALMYTYTAVMLDAKKVHRKVSRLLNDHNYKTYYARRAKFNKEKAHSLDAGVDIYEIAALFLYLNRTCFNGLYRENPKGEFNVPIGSYKTVSCSKDGLIIAQGCLANLGVGFLHSQEWWETLAQVQSDDFVYIDPPYDGGFTAYTKDGFDEADQRDLAGVVRFLAAAVPKVKLMLSNADTPLIRELYAPFDIQTIQAPRAINSKGNGRGNVSEVVIRNYNS